MTKDGLFYFLKHMFICCLSSLVSCSSAKLNTLIVPSDLENSVLRSTIVEPDAGPVEVISSVRHVPSPLQTRH